MSKAGKITALTIMTEINRQINGFILRRTLECKSVIIAVNV